MHNSVFHQLPKSPSAISVLLIDDDEDILESLRDLLEVESGFDVETARDANSAIALLDRVNPDIAFIDIRLGSDNGLELITNIKHKVPGISCIMMTAHREVDYAVKALRAGANDYLFKPIAPEHFLHVVNEIARRHQAANLSPSNDRNINTILKHSSGFIFILSPTGDCREAGSAALSFIDQSWDDIKGKPFHLTPWWQGSETYHERIKAVIEVSAAGYPSSFEAELFGDQGKSAWYEFSFNPVFDNDHQVSMIIVEGHDLTKYKNIEQDLRKISLYDSLTGLPNRALLLEHLEREVACTSRNSHHFSVMFIDLDHFKAVNDVFGHQAGDELLVDVAKALQACLREGDIIARLGGDEFVVVLSSEENIDSPSKIAERLLQSITKLDYDVGSDQKISASIGIAAFPEHGTEVETLMKNADMAMYQAKSQGKGTYQYFKPPETIE